MDGIFPDKVVGMPARCIGIDKVIYFGYVLIALCL